MTIRDMQQCPHCGTRIVVKADGTCPACQSALPHVVSSQSAVLPEAASLADSAPPRATGPQSIQSLYDEVFLPFEWRRLWQGLCIGSLCLLAGLVVADRLIIPDHHSADRPAALVIVRGLLALAQLVCYTLVVIFAIGWLVCRPRLTFDAQQVTPGTMDSVSVANHALSIPASALLLLSVLAVPLDLATMCHQWFVDSNVAGAAIIGLMLSIHLFIMFGAIQMSKLKHYSIAWLAGGMAVVPFCSPVVILGIPFGIWALLKLSDRLVMNAFVLNSTYSSLALQAEDAGTSETIERHTEECPYCEKNVMPNIDGRCPECHRLIA